MPNHTFTISNLRETLIKIFRSIKPPVRLRYDFSIALLFTLLKMTTLIVVAIIVFAATSVNSQCANPTETTVIGTHAPSPGTFCSGDLIFQDNFDTLDHAKWFHDQTMAGGGNDEFQWYVHDRENTFTTNGILHIKPTMTADLFGENFLTTGRVIIPPENCTDSSNGGCDRQGNANYIIHPIRSGLVKTSESFSFKFGTLEIRARNPTGDWLWPALWLMPKNRVYGGWPASGEIDLMESRGNTLLFDGNTNVGTEQVGSTLHFGPRWDVNGYSTAHYPKNQSPGFNEGFHVYKLYWTPTYLQFHIDNVLVGTVNAGTGFWARGGFSWTGLPNPWINGTIMAPFDQEFYIIMNTAIGGTNAFFPDRFENRNGAKPW